MKQDMIDNFRNCTSSKVKNAEGDSIWGERSGFFLKKRNIPHCKYL